MTQPTHEATERVETSVSAMAPPILAILLGAFLVLGIGLAHPDAIHNAAHDSRHAFAFPCH